MIRYNKSWWSFRLYFRLYGSAFPRALPFSLSAATIAGILRGFFPDFMDSQFLHPYPFQAFAYICGFIVVFRCALDAQTDTCGPSATFTSCRYCQASSMPWLGVPFCARHLVRHQSGLEPVRPVQHHPLVICPSQRRNGTAPSVRPVLSRVPLATGGQCEYNVYIHRL